MAKKRDSQRKAVYTWEAVIYKELSQDFRTQVISLNEVKKVVKKISEDYGVPVPEVKDGRGTNTAYAYGKWAVSFPRWARKYPVIIHEMAHNILIRAMNYEAVSHGREFASLVLDMYRRYLGLDHVKARKLGIVQRPRRVRFAKMSDIPKPVKKVYKFKPICAEASKRGE